MQRCEELQKINEFYREKNFTFYYRHRFYETVEFNHAKLRFERTRNFQYVPVVWHNGFVWKVSFLKGKRYVTLTREKDQTNYVRKITHIKNIKNFIPC